MQESGTKHRSLSSVVPPPVALLPELLCALQSANLGRWQACHLLYMILSLSLVAPPPAQFSAPSCEFKQVNPHPTSPFLQAARRVNPGFIYIEAAVDVQQFQELLGETAAAKAQVRSASCSRVVRSPLCASNSIQHCICFKCYSKYDFVCVKRCSLLYARPIYGMCPAVVCYLPG